MNTPLSIRVLRWTVCLIVGGFILTGLYISGSPITQRQYALDEHRINDLSQITYSVDQYVSNHGTLPVSIDPTLPEFANLNTQTHDPATGAAYEYRILPTTTSTIATTTNAVLPYQLCATFDRPTSPDSTQSYTQPAPVAVAPNGSMEAPINWQHGSGTTCFSLRSRTSPTQTTIVK